MSIFKLHNFLILSLIVIRLFSQDCRLQNVKKATKSYVCSRHFCRSDFQEIKSSQRKYILKQGTLPTIFKWDSTTTDFLKDIKTEEISETDIKSEPIKEEIEEPIEPLPGTSTAAKETTTNKTTSIDEENKNTSNNNKKKKNNNNSRKRAGSILIPNEEKPKKTSKRLSAAKIMATTTTALTPTTVPTVISDVAVTVVKPEIHATPDRGKSKNPEGPPPAGTPRKKNTIINFLPGSTIEAQSFDQKWITVKVIEVDIDEREVLVRFEKNNKSKTPG